MEVELQGLQGPGLGPAASLPAHSVCQSKSKGRQTQEAAKSYCRGICQGLSRLSATGAFEVKHELGEISTYDLFLLKKIKSISKKISSKTTPLKHKGQKVL